MEELLPPEGYPDILRHIKTANPDQPAHIYNNMQVLLLQ